MKNYITQILQQQGYDITPTALNTMTKITGIFTQTLLEASNQASNWCKHDQIQPQDVQYYLHRSENPEFDKYHQICNRTQNRVREEIYNDNKQ